MMKQTLGQRIAERHRGRGMTQQTLSEQLNVTPQAVSKWENDASCPDVMLQVDTRDAHGAVGGLKRIAVRWQGKRRLLPAWEQPQIV